MMKPIRYWGLALLACAISLVLLWKPLPARSQHIIVLLQTDPPLSETVANADVVQFRLQALDVDQTPLRNAVLAIRLVAPAKTPWLSTDFPIVEGTPLLDLEAIAPDGAMQFEQRLPIRGTYALDIEVTSAIPGAFQPFAQTLTVSVPENPVKYRNAAILAVLLALAGVGAGWVIAHDQTIPPGEIVPARVRLMLSGAIGVAIAVLLVVNVSAELASRQGHSHEHGHGDVTVATLPATQALNGIRAQLMGETHAQVGQLSEQAIRLTDATTQAPISDAQVAIRAIALEHNETLFAYEGRTNADGVLSWRSQFFDGAPHQVMATVQPGTDPGPSAEPLQVAHEVEVDGVEPPLLTRLISLFYFTAFFVAGLWTGVHLRRRIRRSPVGSPMGQ